MSDPNLSNNPITEWTIAVSYFTDYGLRQQSPCGPIGTPARFVRLFAPCAYKLVEWAASCYGAKPQLPSSDTQNDNEVLMFKQIVANNPGSTVSGDPIWQVVGAYQYGLQIPPSDSDVLSIAGGPFLNPDGVNVNYIGPADFASKYLAPSAKPGAFGGTKISY